MGKTKQTTAKRRKPQHVFIIIGVLHLEAQTEPTNNETNKMVYTGEFKVDRTMVLNKNI